MNIRDEGSDEHPAMQRRIYDRGSGGLPETLMGKSARASVGASSGVSSNRSGSRNIRVGTSSSTTSSRSIPNHSVDSEDEEVKIVAVIPSSSHRSGPGAATRKTWSGSSSSNLNPFSAANGNENGNRYETKKRNIPECSALTMQNRTGNLSSSSLSSHNVPSKPTHIQKKKKHTRPSSSFDSDSDSDSDEPYTNEQVSSSSSGPRQKKTRIQNSSLPSSLNGNSLDSPARRDNATAKLSRTRKKKGLSPLSSLSSSDGSDSDDSSNVDSFMLYGERLETKFYASLEYPPPDYQKSRFNHSMAFCCQVCRCSESKRSRYSKSNRRNTFTCGNTGDIDFGNNELHHWSCCHNMFIPSLDENKRIDENTDDKTPMMLAIDDAFEKESEPPKEVTMDVLQKKHLEAGKQQSQVESENQVASDSSIFTNEPYMKALTKFRQRKKQEIWTVLDLFSGIGSGLVVLKRLGLPLKTYVRVEHDPVANYVFDFHHKNDGTKHILKEKFEDIYKTKDVKQLIKTYGPFDIILAGAPCSDYSPVNKERKGPSGKSGSYLKSVGLLIQKINKLQTGTDVIFLSENVIFTDKKWRKEIRESYGGIDPVQIDAKFLSPCKRNRLYWFNVPIKRVPDGEDDSYLNTTAHDVLDSDFTMPENVIPKKTRNIRDERVSKANTLMAGKSRIDDDRMMKVKKIPGSHRYMWDTFSVSERERMMGLPPDYVSNPLKKLFGEITRDGFINAESSKENKHWSDFMDPLLWQFSHKCRFRFKPLPLIFPYFHLEFSAPQEDKEQPYYFDEEGYGKHLIGNGWSIPVLEHILQSLQDKCERRTDYEGYDYTYFYKAIIDEADV